MQRYFIEFNYDGTAYSGWQMQPDKETVQSTLDRALSTISNQAIQSMGCGRTDSGVHASQFFAHFDMEGELPEHFVDRMNKFLPADVAVRRLIPVHDEAHARFDATYRAYHYYIHFEKSAFLSQHSFFYPWLPLDWESMQKAYSSLTDYEDFKSFQKSNSDSKTSLCSMYETKMVVDEKAGRLKFRIAANRFLRGMVRRVVGAIMMVGKGKITLDEFHACIQTRELFPINISAPACGLYLAEVRYDYIEPFSFQLKKEEEGSDG